jgi:hypothetical protein
MKRVVVEQTLDQRLETGHRVKIPGQAGCPDIFALTTSPTVQHMSTVVQLSDYTRTYQAYYIANVLELFVK